MKPTKLISLLLLTAVLTTSVSCGAKKIAAQPYPGSSDKDTVTVNLLGEPPELNSLLTADAVSGDILRACMSGLIQLDSKDKPQGDLAETWDISEDNTVYTFHLREDVLWSNGEPVTAADFIYSWTHIMTASNAAPYAFLLYENIKNGQAFYDGTATAAELGIQATDDFTLRVELENPMPYALTLFASFCYLPMNQKGYEAIGADNYGKSADAIVTNGPYQLTEWTHDDHILVTKNEEHYRADEISIPEIRFTMITDANASLNAFKAGEIDTTNITGEQQLALQKESKDSASKYYDNGSWFLRYNTQNEFLSNALVREAFGMAIDTDMLCDFVLKDGSVPADGYVPSKIAGANDELYSDARGALYKPDIKKAKALLEEGLKELGKQPSDVTLRYIADDTTYGKLQAEYFKEQWSKNLGVDVQIDIMPFKARLEATKNGNFDIMFSGWAPDFNDPMTFLSLLTTDNTNNLGKYSNPKYDELIAQAMTEVDATKRQALLIEAETLLLSDAAITPLYFSCVPYAISSKLTGMTRTGFQEYDFCDGAKITP